MSIVVTPIPRLIDLAVPAFTLGTANATGSAATAVASDSTLLAFDGVAPSDVAAVAVVGDASVSSRRNHVHAGMTATGTVVDEAIARFDGTGGASLQGYSSLSPTISNAGIVSTPGQTSFAALNTTSPSDVTGNGTPYTVVFNVELFDVGSNFASNTFTAPVAGKYLLCTQIRFSGTTAASTYGELQIKTSNRDWTKYFSLNGTTAGAQAQELTAIADMDASDEAYVRFTTNGEAGDVVDVVGIADNPNTFFQGMLIG